MADAILAASGIYKIRNIETGKVYIGSSINLKKRVSKHKTELKTGRHHSQKLQRAWDKYGAQAFEFFVLEMASNDELIEREQYWLDHFDCANDGYNILPTAGSSSGYKLTEEHRRKIGAGNAGKVRTDAMREKLSIAHMGHSTSVETRAKMGAAATGHSRGRGYKHTAEALKKISEASKLRKFSPESNAKRVATRLANAALK
jgi:group I intron endonuclease